MSMADYQFPDPNTALLSPNGLLAVGGDLSPGRLLAAYRQGIFPWFNPGEPILWWSPDPRAVLFLDQLKISRSLAKFIRQNVCEDIGQDIRHDQLQVTFNHDFNQVIGGCATARKDTWITPEMITAYTSLHQLGHAHSVEVWQQDKLVGGLYGVRVGKVFCGESMFSLVSNASKVAMVHLVARLKTAGCVLIDCQLANPHLMSLGATTIPRAQFIALLTGQFR